MSAIAIEAASLTLEENVYHLTPAAELRLEELCLKQEEMFALGLATDKHTEAGCASKQKGHSLRLAAALQSVMRNLDIQLYGASDLSYGLITKEILEAAILLTTNFTAVHRADFSTEGEGSSAGLGSAEAFAAVGKKLQEPKEDQLMTFMVEAGRKIFETKGGSVFTGPAMIKLLANTARKAAVPAKHLCRMLAERSGVLQYIEYTTEGNKAQKQCASYILQTWQLDGQEAGAITQLEMALATFTDSPHPLEDYASREVGRKYIHKVGQVDHGDSLIPGDIGVTVHLKLPNRFPFGNKVTSNLQEEVPQTRVIATTEPAARSQNQFLQRVPGLAGAPSIGGAAAESSQGLGSITSSHSLEISPAVLLAGGSSREGMLEAMTRAYRADKEALEKKWVCWPRASHRHESGTCVALLAGRAGFCAGGGTPHQPVGYKQLFCVRRRHGGRHDTQQKREGG